MVTFKNLEFNTGDITKGTTVRVEYEYDGDSSTITHVSPSCGCTANCRKEGNNKIVADFTATDTGNFSKNINVFFENKATLQLKIVGKGV